MKSCKAMLGVAAMALGGAGVLACVAVMVVIWIGSARLGQEAENLSGKMDRSLAVIRQRVVALQGRVAAAAIGAEDLEKLLRDWTKQAAVQRIVSQVELSERTERLTSTLEDAEHWLENSEAFLGILQDMLSVGAATTAPTDAGSVDRLLEEVTSLRAQLAEATDVVAGIHERLAEEGEEKSLEERLRQAARLAVRVAAMLSSAAPRLEKLADSLWETQIRIQGLQAESRRWLLMIALGGSFLVIWMGAGQAALCSFAWKYRRKCSALARHAPPSLDTTL